MSAAAERDRAGPSPPGTALDPVAEARRQWTERSLPRPAAVAGITSLMRAQQLASQVVERAVRPHGLTFPRYEALMLLSFTREGRLPLAKVGERLMVHPTSVTNLVDKLERDGLVRREPHPTDRRTTLASITDEGRRAAAEATASLGEVGFGMPLGADDLEELIRLLTTMRRAAGELPPER